MALPSNGNLANNGAINNGRVQSGRVEIGRSPSSHRIEAYEDPVSGLQRVDTAESLSNSSHRRRRRRDGSGDDDAMARRLRRRDSTHLNVISERFESLDYEIVENELYRDEERHVEHQQNLWRQSLNRWVVCFMIGVCTAIVACVIDIMLYYSSHLKFDIILKSLFEMCAKSTSTSCIWIPELAWIAYNCILVGVAACLVLFVSPVAAGSGIPQIKCFLNGIQIPGVVRLKTLVAKAIGVACSVAGGLSVGKEGPMIHSGAVIAAGISQGRCVSLPIDFHVFESFRNDREKRDFVSAGAAAGVAAAFGAPIGGVLFSLEEGCSFWNQSLTWRIFFSAMISSFTLSTLLGLFYKEGGWLSWNGLANFGTFKDTSYNIWEIPFFMLIGIIGGLSGAAFNALNHKLSIFRKRYVINRWQKFLECIFVAALSALIAFVTILWVDDCHPIGMNPNQTDVIQLWCPTGEYSGVADLFFNTPEESVKRLLHFPINSFRPWTLAIFTFEYYILTLWTYGLSVPSGIFIPTLLTGAAWGRLFGIGVEKIFPAFTGVDPGKYALAGAAAQLGGVVRMTISLTAIIIEATKEVSFGLPIMVVLMMAKWVGDMFNEGLYDAHIALSEVPILGWHPPKLSRNILAEKVMRKDVIAMERQERVAHVLEVLLNTQHHGFPVVDEIGAPDGGMNDDEKYPRYGHLKGLILRSQLITLLKQRVFSHDIAGTQMVAGYQPVSLRDFRDAYPRYNACLDDLKITAEDGACWMNLERYMHPNPHRVPLNASLPAVFRLFRGLGLRYLLVVNDDNLIKGIITRKDVARFKERRQRSRYEVNEAYFH